MSGSGNHIVACIVLLALGSSGIVVNAAAVIEGTNYNITAYCTVVKPGTTLGSIISCSTYYRCQYNGPVQLQCGSGYAYDKNYQTCRPAYLVDCYFGVTNPCIGKNDNTFVPDVSVCGGWIMCKSQQKSTSGTCPPGQTFSNGACIYGNCPDNTNVSNEPVLSSACQIMPPNVFFGSTLNCSTWQYCDQNNGLQEGKCSEGTQTAFDATTGFCNYPSTVSCSWVTGKEINPDLGSCTQNGKHQPDAFTCSKYYICNGKTYQEYTCSFGQYYDVNKQSCNSRQAATPVSTCNRCEFTSALFVNGVSSTNCAAYSVCKYGVSSSTGNCPSGFFNEDLQGCQDYNFLAPYVATHGVCAGATDPNAPPVQVPGGDTGNGGTGSGETGTGGTGSGETGTGGTGTGGTGTGETGTGGTGTGETGTGGTGTGGTGTGETGSGGTGTGETGSGGTGTGETGSGGTGTGGTGTGGTGTGETGSGGTGGSGTGGTDTGTGGTGTGGTGTGGTGTGGTGTGGTDTGTGGTGTGTAK